MLLGRSFEKSEAMRVTRQLASRLPPRNRRVCIQLDAVFLENRTSSGAAGCAPDDKGRLGPGSGSARLEKTRGPFTFASSRVNDQADTLHTMAPRPCHSVSALRVEISEPGNALELHHRAQCSGDPSKYVLPSCAVLKVPVSPAPSCTERYAISFASMLIATNRWPL
jgi:hypothetical protein